MSKSPRIEVAFVDGSVEGYTSDEVVSMDLTGEKVWVLKLSDGSSVEIFVDKVLYYHIWPLEE